MLVSEELRDIRLFQVNDLKLEVISSSSNLEDILDGLLRTTHPETLSVVSPSNCEFLKVLLFLIESKNRYLIIYVDQENVYEIL